MDLLRSLERFGGEVLVGLSLVLLTGALVVRCIRSPLHRHQVALLTIATASLGSVLLLAPLQRPARWWPAAALERLATTSPEPAADAATRPSSAIGPGTRAEVVDPALGLTPGDVELPPQRSSGLRSSGLRSSGLRSSGLASSGLASPDPSPPEAEIQGLPKAALGPLQPSPEPVRARSADAPALGPEIESGSAPAGRRLSVGRALLVLLLLGALASTLRLLGAWWTLAHLLKRSQPAPRWIRDLQGLPPRGAPAQIRISASARRPFCAGLQRGVVVLPRELVDVQRPRRVEAVLRHESAHLELGHARARAVAALAAPVLYWNPLYWWLCAVMRHSAELLADDHAVVALDRRTYVAELLALAESSIRPSRSVVFGLGVFGPRSDFLSRMETLLMRSNPLAHRSSRSQTVLRNALACVVLGTVTLALGHPSQSVTGSAQPVVTDPAIPHLTLSQARSGQSHLRAASQPEPVVRGSATRGSSTLGSSARGVATRGVATIEFLARDAAALARLLLRTGGGDLSIEADDGDNAFRGSLTVHLSAGDAVQDLVDIEGVLLVSVKQTRPATRNAPPADATLRSQVDELQNRVDQLTRFCAQMHDSQKDLTNRLQRARQDNPLLSLNRLGPGAGPSTAGGPGGIASSEPPVVTGSVLHVQDDATQPNVVLIDCGTEQGVVSGMKLEVYSGSTYKGSLRVIDLMKSVSICRPEQILSGVEVVTGDRITSRL